MASSRWLTLVVLVAGIGIGAAARDLIGDGEPVQSSASGSIESVSVDTTDMQNYPPPSADMVDELELLRAQLSAAEQERSELREQLAELTVRVQELDGKSASASKAPQRTSMRQRRRGAGSLTVEALTEAGIDERDATAIKARLDDLSLQRLYLRDQAQREGWVGKEQYRDEIKRINEAQANLANEFGDENYARYLYATGRPNQVTVDSVIDNSAAYNTGVKAGDRIVSYDNSNIYGANEIRRSTMRGTSNELVRLVVERDGQQLELYIPRGPLGVQLNSNSVRPPDTGN